MLIPQSVIKSKFTYINGEVVPIESIVTENIEYSIDDFTEEGLLAIIDAGHADYFNESEKGKLLELGILGMNEYSWSEIKDLIQAGHADYFKVGDTKDITLDLPAGDPYFTEAVSGTYKVVVIGVNHNPELEGTNRVHFCIGQDSTGKEISFYGRKMNSTARNSGGWNGSAMKTFLNDTFYNALPSDLKNVITECTKYTDNTGNASNTADAVTSTSQKIWLLAEFEFFGTRTYANQYEQNSQAQYDYYKNGNSRIRYKNNSQDTYWCYWWLRSPNCSISYGFCSVYGNGIANRYNADYSYGVVPCFTIS